jgi:hypothetical protein
MFIFNIWVNGVFKITIVKSYMGIGHIISLFYGINKVYKETEIFKIGVTAAQCCRGTHLKTSHNATAVHP